MGRAKWPRSRWESSTASASPRTRRCTRGARASDAATSWATTRPTGAFARVALGSAWLTAGRALAIQQPPSRRAGPRGVHTCEGCVRSPAHGGCDRRRQGAHVRVWKGGPARPWGLSRLQAPEGGRGFGWPSCCGCCLRKGYVPPHTSRDRNTGCVLCGCDVRLTGYIACGDAEHTLVLTAQGKVFAFGYDQYGASERCKLDDVALPLGEPC